LPCLIPPWLYIVYNTLQHFTTPFLNKKRELVFTNSLEQKGILWRHLLAIQSDMIIQHLPGDIKMHQ
jgi:hypothetical protein